MTKTDPPFTLDHFKEWASRLTLDNGEKWVLEPFQEAFVADVFSFGPRSQCWLVVPEGNGKTTLIAGIALYHCQHTKTAGVPVAASSREQAEIVFRQAEGFVNRSEEVLGGFRCQEGYRRIRYDETGSRIQIFASDDRQGDGIIPTLCILDELHRHKNLRLYQTWAGKLVKRGAQIVTISTAGEPGSEFERAREQIRQKAGDVTRKETFTRAAAAKLVLHEWAVPEGGDVEDIALVKRANPFTGITEDLLQEKLDSPTMTMQHWRRFVCNLPTREKNAAIQESEWHGAVTEETIPEGETVDVGLDVGWKGDTTAAVPLWWRDDEFRLFGSASILTPPRDGSGLHPDEIKGALLEIHGRNPIATLVMDVHDAREISVWAADELGCFVVEWPQTAKYKGWDFARFMEALRNGWLFHSGDQGLTSHVLNAVAHIQPLGDPRFVRPHDSRRGQNQEQRVIDALDAAAMVHSHAVGTQTTYGERGLVAV